MERERTWPSQHLPRTSPTPHPPPSRDTSYPAEKYWTRAGRLSLWKNGLRPQSKDPIVPKVNPAPCRTIMETIVTKIVGTFEAKLLIDEYLRANLVKHPNGLVSYPPGGSDLATAEELSRLHPQQRFTAAIVKTMRQNRHGALRRVGLPKTDRAAEELRVEVERLASDLAAMGDLVRDLQGRVVKLEKDLRVKFLGAISEAHPVM